MATPISRRYRSATSFAENFKMIAITRNVRFSSKRTTNRFVAGLCSDPVGSLRRSPDSVAGVRGGLRKGERKTEGKGGQ